MNKKEQTIKWNYHCILEMFDVSKREAQEIMENHGEEMFRLLYTYTKDTIASGIESRIEKLERLVAELSTRGEL